MAAKDEEIPRKKRGRPPAHLWSDDVYVQAYQLARTGMGDEKVADALGVSYPTFVRWRKERPALRNALRKARQGDKVGVKSFKEYAYDRLPEHLRALWDSIMECEKAKTPLDRLEAMLSRAGKTARQHLFLYALISSNFNVTHACRLVNVNRKTFDKWATADPDFAELLEEVEWHKGNFFENGLLGLVAEGHAGAILFANRTYNSRRGYAHKDERHVTVGGVVEHRPVAIEDLNLDIETRKKMLEAYRAKQLPPRRVETQEVPNEG